MQHQHISAGSFHVGSAQSIILEAYLGTCVGVALFDPDARVGGWPTSCSRSRFP